MAEKRRSLVGWLLVRLVIFAVGVGVGYYVRDREMDRLQAAYEQTKGELDRIKASGEVMIERGRRAGEELKGGAKAAADSTKGALQEIQGGARQ